MRITFKGAEVYAYTGSRPFDPARPSLVFVHGAAHDHSVWALQSRYFAFHGWNVLAVDLPGHGRSGGDVLESVEAIADWLIAVLDAAAIKRAALVGHSMGSLAVLECAGRHPDRVTHATLIGPALPMAVSDALLDAAQRDDHVAFELINGWSYSARKQRGGNQVPGMWMTGSAMRLLERTRPGVLYRDLVACKDYVGGVEAARGVRCPTLLILAARDIMAPIKLTKELVATLREARVVTLAGAGHAMMAEEPDAVLDALRGFLPAA
jgi:pimeloyl-ACP methyl ester carboxylesterase